MSGIESSIFMYKDWDVAGGDYGDIIFYECTLIRNVGQFKKGTIIPSITIIYSKSVMEFYPNENDFEKRIKFNISLNIDD